MNVQHGAHIAGLQTVVGKVLRQHDAVVFFAHLSLSRGDRKALQLFDLVVEDTGQYLKTPRCERLASQQLASADSVCSNSEEGYGRERTAEYRRFLSIARGSLRETLGR